MDAAGITHKFTPSQEVGIAVLDPLNPTTITTRNIKFHVSGGPVNSRSASHRKFFFGQSETYKPNEFGNIFTDLLNQGDRSQIILVDHRFDIGERLATLKDCGIDLLNRETYPSFLGFLDTGDLFFRTQFSMVLRVRN